MEVYPVKCEAYLTGHDRIGDDKNSPKHSEGKHQSDDNPIKFSNALMKIP